LQVTGQLSKYAVSESVHLVIIFFDEKSSSSLQDVSRLFQSNGSRLSAQFTVGISLGVAVGLVDGVTDGLSLAVAVGLALGLPVVHTGLHVTGQFSRYAGIGSEHLEIALMFENPSNSVQEVCSSSNKNGARFSLQSVVGFVLAEIVGLLVGSEDAILLDLQFGLQLIGQFSKKAESESEHIKRASSVKKLSNSKQEVSSPWKKNDPGLFSQPTVTLIVGPTEGKELGPIVASRSVFDVVGDDVLILFSVGAKVGLFVGRRVRRCAGNLVGSRVLRTF
jgi:hypothetical protein